MTDPAVQQAEEDLDDAVISLLAAAVRLHKDPLHQHRISNLVLAANSYGQAVEDHLAVLATLGDGTS